MLQTERAPFGVPNQYEVSLGVRRNLTKSRCVVLERHYFRLFFHGGCFQDCRREARVLVDPESEWKCVLSPYWSAEGRYVSIYYGNSMVAVSKTRLLSKLGFKPVVMYFL